MVTKKEKQHGRQTNRSLPQSSAMPSNHNNANSDNKNEDKHDVSFIKEEKKNEEMEDEGEKGNKKHQENAKRTKRGRARVINNKTARGMLNWSHFRFRQLLLSKSREYPDCKVIICDEHYTSKTCGACGFIHYGLGGNKVMKQIIQF